MAPRMKEIYEKKVRAALAKRFGYSNPMEVPRLEKIVLNRGIGGAKDNPKMIEGAVADLTAISGQKPILTKARKSIAQFKLRAGYIVGCQVTLRRDRMYEFFDRLVNFAVPQIRDFRGVSERSFDGRGNFNLGLNEQLIFPEIDYDDIASIAGVTVTVCTTAGTDEEAKALLSELGMPFRRPSR